MIYNWQCLLGHSGEIPAGSRLEEMQIKRVEDGYLDAFCLSFEQCPECVAKQIEQLRREVRLCSESGCIYGCTEEVEEGGDCAQGCASELDLRNLEASYVLLENRQFGEIEMEIER